MVANVSIMHWKKHKKGDIYFIVVEGEVQQEWKKWKFFHNFDTHNIGYLISDIWPHFVHFMESNLYFVIYAHAT